MRKPGSKQRRAGALMPALGVVAALVTVVVISSCAERAMEPLPRLFGSLAYYGTELDPIDVHDCGAGYQLDYHYPDCVPCDPNPTFPQAGCPGIPTDPCLLDPSSPGCGDPCSVNPSAPGCQCVANPSLCNPPPDGGGGGPPPPPPGEAPCNDERDAMAQEYVTWGSVIRPSCRDFDNMGGTPAFSWAALNGYFGRGNPHNPWGMIKQSLLDGLEQTSDNYLYNYAGDMYVTSGYRCPDGNSNVGGVINSYHTRGRAGDMYGVGLWNATEFGYLRESARLTMPHPVELLTWDWYADHHLHAAW